ncbi:MAG TPA: hypothetical protein DDW23_02935 [Planctomycetes bacterium]|nr:hypothetical protein [Planctomycetota bacterium]|tara:strand:+ start:67 stop:1080 length:1014 start_codon:yes stop_codon:yes gene_type:complete
MKNVGFSILVLPVLAVLVGVEVGVESKSSSPMVKAAQDFLEALDSAQLEGCRLPLEHEERLAWSYLPGARKGIWIGDLTSNQRIHLTDLLQSVLSSAGYLKTEGILVLESVLAELQPNAGRDPGRYAFTLFGEPGNGLWGWSLEGHHLSLNFTGGKSGEVRSTPLFFGVAPATVVDGPHTGLRPLGAEVELARNLLDSLDDANRKAAQLSETRPRDVVMGPARNEPLPMNGLPVAAMGTDQRANLFAIIEEYLGNLHPVLAREEAARIRNIPLGDVRFSWTGDMNGGPFYYRILGPKFSLEYACVGNDPTHAHAVWRDLERDFGVDILQDHLSQEHR